MPRLLCAKLLLQLEDDAPGGTLEEIEEAFKSAIERDENYVEAYIELGYYYYSIQDNSEKAREQFLKAFELLRQLTAATINGLVDCDIEMHPRRSRKKLKSEYENLLKGPSPPS